MTHWLKPRTAGRLPKVIECVPVEHGSRVYAPEESADPTESESAPDGIVGSGKTAGLLARVLEDGSMFVDDRRLPTVTNEVFGISEPSLQQIRDAWQERHKADGDSQGKLAVTPQGRMVLVSAGDRRSTQLPEVTDEVFAASATEAVDLLPSNATWMVVGGVGGWVYSFSDSHYGDRYTVFLYQVPSTGRYHAKLVSPDPSELRHHHWYSDGRMCLTTDNGSCASVAHAHARVVAWAKASSHWRRTGQWLFD